MKAIRFYEIVAKINKRMTLQQRLVCFTSGVVILLGLILILFINLIAPLFSTQEVGIPDTYILNNSVNTQGTSTTIIYITPAPEGYTIFREMGIKRTEPLTAVKILSVIGFLLVVGLAFFTTRWIARKTMEPVYKISTIAQQITARNLDKRINYQGSPDEVKKLADAFDFMLERLEDNFDKQNDFIGNLAHELKTPLTSLRMNLEVLRADPHASLDDFQSYSESAERALSRLEHLVSDFLLLAKAEKEIDYQKVVIGVLFEDILEELKPIAEKNMIELRMSGEIEIELWGDPVLLHRAFSNIVENGIYYNQTGGFVEISAIKKSNQIVIEIQDNGIGISVQQQTHIFERFYRGAAGKRNNNGKGLGLAISAHIINLHDGRIEVDSVLGKGSTFRIFLQVI